MKKKLFALMLLPLLLCSCDGGEDASLSRRTVSSSQETTSSVTESSNPDTSSKEEEGDYIHNLKEEEYKSFYTHYYKRLKDFKSFKSVTKGETKATVLFVTVDQPIDTTVIKSEYSYTINESHSTFADTEHKAYYHGDKVVCRDYGEDNWSTMDLNAYLDKYGFYPFDDCIEGYIVNEENITKITVKKSGENYVISIDLDVEKSTNNVRIQMKQFGNLDNYPTFKKINLKLTLKDDYTPVSIDLDAKYDAKKGVATSCHQEYTVTFSNFDEEIEVPNLEEVKPLFN